VYAQRKAGIFISLSRVRLNRRSTSTSFSDRFQGSLHCQFSWQI
jgi:hypothetical protein